ncbi:MAG: transglutaminase-like domain-containing protein [Cyanobacteriota bacterium]|jgi:transglutaminase-like putative cysteine protease
MWLRIQCEWQFFCEQTVPVLALVHPHASRRNDLLGPETLSLTPDRAAEVLMDAAGNRWCRFLASNGTTTLLYSATICDQGQADPVVKSAVECPLTALPIDTYRFLNPSRYCDTDRLASVAWDQFASVSNGWSRVQAVCDWVHQRLRFDYGAARSDKTAYDAMEERAGVCRDFAHLAISLCRCLNIPARYCTGYLGYTGIPLGEAPVDFSAWFEAYLGDRWYVFDARHNTPRLGRVLIARGRDAADVPFLRTFGPHQLRGFHVLTESPAMDNSSVSRDLEHADEPAPARNPRQNGW